MGEVRVFEVPDPQPWVDVLLPEKSGKLRGQVTMVEGRPDGAVWIEVAVSSWKRWSTQLEVGKPSFEGIGPQRIRMWAPSSAVLGEDEDVRMLRELYQANRLTGAVPAAARTAGR